MNCFLQKVILFTFLAGISGKTMSVNAILFDGTGQAAENKLIAITLAGIVNREEPRLYLLNVYETWSYSQTDEKWRDIYTEDGGVNFTVISNINNLVTHFSPYINGAITYDPALTYGNFTGQNFRWQAEVASMIGGLTDCIPIPYNNTSIQIDKPDSVWVPDYFHNQEPLKISARLESGSHPWNNSSLTQEERYFLILDWALEHLLSRTNPAKFYLREITDWAINQRMFQLNLAGTESLNFYSLSDAKASRIEQVMSYLRSSRPDKIFHVYGWMRPEPLVQWISAWGGSFHETLLSNLSWHHIFPAQQDFTYDRPSLVKEGTIALEEKHYVLFIGSEGDAGNWVIGFQAGAWHSQSRGLIPIGWGFNLHMFEEFPFVGQYYYKTATALDGFISVTSPLGYAYSDMFPESYLPDAIEKSSHLLSRFQIPTVYAYKHYNGAGVSSYRGVVISNNYNFNKLGSFAEATSTDLTFLFDPALQTQKVFTNYGGLLYNHVNDDTFYANVTSIEGTSERIINRLKNRPKPGFLLAGYQRTRQDGTSIGTGNPADITLPRLKTIMEMIQSDPTIGQDVEFVTPETFTYLIKKSHESSFVISKNQNDKDFLKAFFDQYGSLNIHLRSDTKDFLTVRLIDISGRVVMEEYPESNQLNNFLLLNGSYLKNGIYILNISGKGLWLNQKIIK